MTRTTIVIPDEVKTKAFDYSRRKGISFGEFVRQAIEDKIHAENGAEDSVRLQHQRSVGKLLSFADGFPSGPADLTKNLDDYLYGERKSGI